MFSGLVNMCGPIDVSVYFATFFKMLGGFIVLHVVTKQKLRCYFKQSNRNLFIVSQNQQIMSAKLTY
jgi:hypothetical protein